MHPIDQVHLSFDSKGLMLLNVILGLIMFGVALDLSAKDFRELAKRPIAPAVGLVAQFFVLPAVAFGLSRLLAPTPSIALGMILVASCPGGNVSNFITHFARGRTTTSVGMTAVSTLAAVVMTPLNFVFWGSLASDTEAMVSDVALDPVSMLGTIALLLGAPVFLGMMTAAHYPRVAARLRKPFQVASMLFFAAFVFAAFHANFDYFLRFIGLVFVPVLVMNAVALLTGWGAARAAALPAPDRRAVAIEVGIQNSGLALILAFDFLDGIGGIAVVSAWWGIWHILAGLTLGAFWRRIPTGEEV
ncbi:MAG: bile acid:sodium symporter family protein [Deltaproteobacteria bacterium]|nr:MAG: bile acid:sodium symporter family protein [Deltaproteobacteria bacterium]